MNLFRCIREIKETQCIAITKKKEQIMKSMLRKRGWAIATGLAAVPGILCVVVASELDPPGPPGNTFETQIREADLPLTITVSGAYHLSEDINTAGGGITVSTNNVTIDLMGFTLDGASGDGIA